jgi:hypothetical protein
LVEQGRHEELLAAKGRYWELLRRQQLEDEIVGEVVEGEVGAGEPAGPNQIPEAV